MGSLAPGFPFHAGFGLSSYLREKFENWASDFILSEAAKRIPDAQQTFPLLVEFLLSACQKAAVQDINDLKQNHLKDAMLEVSAKFKMTERQLTNFPDLCAGLLEHLQREGRLSGGREMGQYLKPFKGKLNKTETIVRPGSKVGRNDPCPCGSGKKYKTCCMNLLG